MNELAIFAGSGCGLLATAALGWTTICAVELDWYCRCLLTQRQIDGVLRPFPIWDDVCTFDGRPWRGRVDVVSGGFPCQAYSTAAAGRNVADDLWPEMRRVVADVAPRYVFAENVSATAIEQAAQDLCAMGYQADMLPLSAQDVGADHFRERYWLLAYSDDKSQLRGTVNAKMAGMQKFSDRLWETGPCQSGVDDGTAARMERYSAIGNGQMPVVAAAALWTLANA